MKNYAQIVNNKVKTIAVFDGEPSFEPQEGYWVDVTDIDAGIGWGYDPNTSAFIEPLPEVPEKPTIITNEEFWDRFTETEKENLVDSTNKKIKKFLYELRIRSTINLANQQIINSVNALETAGIIGAGRAEEILT